MNDAKQIQDRLRDRLATADLRLSVLVDAGAFVAPGYDGGVREAAGTGGMVHGPIRANLTQRMLNELSASPTTVIED